MKNFKIRKRLLAILISSNILLTGCSITGEISKEKEESDDSIQISIPESSNEESKEDDEELDPLLEKMIADIDLEKLKVVTQEFNRIEIAKLQGNMTQIEPNVR